MARERNMEQDNLRPSWEEYFIGMAQHAATRSSCITRKVGAVIVRDNIVISTGYNGTPRGIKNCNAGGCKRCDDRKQGKLKSGANLEECVCLHAEENAIIQAAYHGVPVKGAALYTSFCPCSYCAKSIINAGIQKVYYNRTYNLDEISQELFKEAGIELVQYRNRKTVKSP